MKKIKVEPTWLLSDSDGNQLNPQLFKLLREVNQNGKLTEAARQLDISYRHAWNLIQKWTAFFGTPLIDMQKGRGAKLTELGSKLLWAEERVVARLGPQMESLASELTTEIEKAINPETLRLSLYASHGYAVALLPDILKEVNINIQYTTGEQAIEAVSVNACQMAGFHLPTQLMGSDLYHRYKLLMQDTELRVIRFITREQGLMIKPENNKKINGISNLSDESIRFVNREKTSGTSALLNELIKKAGIKKEAIKGFETREYTHSAVAAYVASGMADTGLGVQPPANQFGLSFIPVAKEHYFFICKEEQLETKGIKTLLRGIEGDVFKEAIETLPGYKCEAAGTVLTVDEMFEILER